MERKHNFLVVGSVALFGSGLFGSPAQAAETEALPPAAVVAPAATSPPSTLAAPRHYFGVSIMGVAGFLRLNVGSFEVYYERVLARHHGLRFAGDFVHIHHNAEYVKAHEWTFGGSFTYRYYAGEAQGVFGGLKVGYRRGFGHYGDHGSPEYTETYNDQILVLPQAGYRFLIPRAHVSIVPAFGIGYTRVQLFSTRDDEVAQSAIRILRDNLATLPVAIDLELSVAYAF